jgi:hypothetical protein
MNHSLYSADCATHVKIVAVALVAATLVAGIGITARVSAPVDNVRAEGVIKAGAPIAVSSSPELQTVR